MRCSMTPAAGLALLLVGCGADAGGVPLRDRSASAPAPRHFTPAETTVTPTPATTPAPDPPRHLVAAIRRPALLRAAPDGEVLARVGRRTEFGSPTVLSVLRRRGEWLQVLHPAIENGQRAWIPAASAQLQGTGYEIRIRRSARVARLLRDGRTVMRFPVAIGRPGNETPLGRFAVTDKLRPADPNSPYGCCAVALTGRQPKLVPGWPGGDRLAIHHTPAEATVGQAVSLGCLRATRRPLERLMRRLPLGTPVFVRA